MLFCEKLILEGSNQDVYLGSILDNLYKAV